METVNDTAMHVTETKTLCSSLTCPKTKKSEEITEEKEEELLYGNIEDGDEEDALSDDSIRLRVSDDEADLDERSPSESISNDKIVSESINMELGSTVSANDISERKSALRRENLTNGKLTLDESVRSCVVEEDQVPNPDVTSDMLPIVGSADYLNGDSKETEKKQYSFLGGSTTRRPVNRNPASGVRYFRCTNRNTHVRPPHSRPNRYVTNSYNNRYYNRNNHYGGGKGSGRGYNVHPRESLTSDSASTLPSEDSNKETENRRNPDLSQDAKIKTEETNNVLADILETTHTGASHIAPDVMKDSYNNRELEVRDTKDFLKNDNAESAPDSVYSTDQVSANDQATREDSITGAIVKNELNQHDGKSEEVENCNASVASDDTLIADDAHDIAGNLSEDEKKQPSMEIQSKSCGQKLESLKNELGNDEMQEVDEKVEKTINDDKNLLEEESKERPTDAATTVLEKSDDRIVSKKDSVKTDTRIESIVESGTATCRETEEIMAAEQSKINDNPSKDRNETIEKSSGGPSQPQKRDVLSSDQAEKSNDQLSSVVDKSDPEVVEKRLSDVKSERVVEDSPAVAMEDSETVEKHIDTLDGEKPPEPKTSLIEDSIADLPDEKESSTDEDNDGSNVTVHSSLKRMSTEFLDEMELSKRMRIQRKKTNDSSEFGPPKDHDSAVVSANEKISIDDETFKDNGSIVNPVTNSSDADTKSVLKFETDVMSNNVVESSAIGAKAEQEKSIEPESADDDDHDDKEKIDDCVLIEVPTKRKQKRVRRSLQNLQETVVSQEDTQEKENVRQKRRTAKNAEEIIRKEFLGNSDSDSTDSAGKFVAVNYNKNSNDLRAASPPSLKRNHIEEDDKVEPKFVKKLKQDFEINGDVPKVEPVARDDKVQTLRHVRQFFRRDNTGGLAKLKQEELEELLIQKVVETITMRDEIGKLREQAKISERNQEATRLRCLQLSKQIKDFEMVLNRYHSDRRSNPDKTVVPIKINRSVGLQVNFVTDHGIQNLRQLGQAQKSAPPIVNGVTPPQRIEQSPNPISVVKRTVKIRSPRRPDPVSPAAPITIPSPVHSQPIISNITPAALVVAKSMQDTRTSVTTTVQQTSISQLMSSNQTILVNGLTNTPLRQTTIQMSKTKNNSDLIDLTQEEEKIKTTMIPQNAILTTALAEASANVTNVSNIQQRYHTVIQTIPGSVAITAPSGIRLVQPTSQPTPTALVNNMNAPRLAYVMQGGIGGPRQVVITSAPTPIRPAPDHQNRPIRATFPISGTITNGTVRVIPTSTTATLQVCKHPASLPEPINPPSNPSWKLPPPAPSLKISKVANGIVLSWNMALSDKFADIASYQLYAYQEVSGIPPSSTLWKKVGDVRALPLPMACTLTQFSEGNNYYFAVRAVDRHSRLGQYSQPGNISL